MNKLIDFIESSKTPYHCIAETEKRLQAAGFTRLCEKEDRLNIKEQGAYYGA